MYRSIFTTNRWAFYADIHGPFRPASLWHSLLVVPWSLNYNWVDFLMTFGGWILMTFVIFNFFLASTGQRIHLPFKILTHTGSVWWIHSGIPDYASWCLLTSLYSWWPPHVIKSTKWGICISWQGSTQNKVRHVNIVMVVFLHLLHILCRQTSSHKTVTLDLMWRPISVQSLTRAVSEYLKIYWPD